MDALHLELLAAGWASELARGEPRVGALATEGFSALGTLVWVAEDVFANLAHGHLLRRLLFHVCDCQTGNYGGSLF